MTLGGEVISDNEKPLTPEEIDELEHSFLGPTWQTNDDGSWLLPELTLGWQIAGWCSKYLQGGGENGDLPWKFTKEQIRFVLWWYAVDRTGRFVYRMGGLQRLKGWGKDPLLAVLCLVELCGPSQFSHFEDDGNPVGKAHPRAYVQVTAVSQSQTENTMDFIPSLLTDKLIAEYGLKPGAEIIRANRGRQKLIAVTSSYRALEGKRTTFTLLNETHHWVLGNKGHKMYETIDGNATKLKGRYLAITNAYEPGEDSVGERMRDAWEKSQDGRAADISFLYDSIEAHELTPLTPEALRIVIPKIRGDATWLDPESIIESVLDTSIPPQRSRRMWLNQIVAQGDSLYGPDQWKAIEAHGVMLRAGDEITLGFDGGKTDDATALVAFRIKDRVAFLLHLQECPEGPAGEGWEVNRPAVETAVHDTFRLYKVRGFYADVAQWETQIDDWAELYREELSIKASERHAVAWDMRTSLKRVTMAHERLLGGVFNKKLGWNDIDVSLRRHALNAKRHGNQFGISFRKESRESPRKVDAYAALMLAYEAFHDYRTRGKQTKERSGRVWAF